MALSSKAEYAAWHLMKERNLPDPRLYSIKDIAMMLGVLVVELPLVGAEARLVCDGDVGIVRLRQGIPEYGRRRFAVAHELGHWILHRGADSGALCSADDIGRFGADDREVQANEFAAAFLMPGPLMATRCRDASPSLNDIISVADEFGTTITATAVRFVQINRNTCVVVFSQNEVVKWWRRSQDSRLWISPREKIDRRSNAFACEGITDMEPVDLDVWFPDENNRPSGVLLEQSMVLGTYGITLTLLWLIDQMVEEEMEDRWSTRIGRPAGR